MDPNSFASDALEYALAKIRFEEAFEALQKWKRARPFLFFGQFAYSRNLLKTMLEAYLVSCKFKNEEPDQELVELFLRLMWNGPPPRTPPRAKAPSGALLFKVISATLLKRLRAPPEWRKFF